MPATPRTAVESQLESWFATKLPPEWSGSTEVQADADEILVVLTLPDADGDPSERIARFREETRERRMAIAAEAERLFNRKVSWGAAAGQTRILFTHLGLPVMTRLRLPERRVLDTLVAAGVARSRSHALAWCARLVAEHEADWLQKLRDAFAEVERVRREGPTSVSSV